MTDPTDPAPDPFPAALRELAEQLYRAATATPELTLLVVLIHTDPRVGGLIAGPGPVPGDVAWRPVPGRSAAMSVFRTVEGDTCPCPACTARRARERVEA